MAALFFPNRRRRITGIVGLNRRRVGPDKGPNDLVVFEIPAHLALIFLRESDKAQLAELHRGFNESRDTLGHLPKILAHEQSVHTIMAMCFEPAKHPRRI